MAKILIKRSNVPNKIPDKSILDFGELGLNTYDGKMYMRRASDDTIVEVGNVSAYLGYQPTNKSGDTFTGTITLAGGATTRAPLKFQQGLLMTDPDAHAMEWDGANLYMTNNGEVRKTIAYTDSNITGKSAGWNTARTITFNGDASGSVSINGTANVIAPLTLLNVNTTIGTFGDAKTIPEITVNAKGLVTSVVARPITLGVADITGAAPLVGPSFSGLNASTPSVTINTSSTSSAVAALILNATQGTTGRNVLAFHVTGTRYGSISAANDGILNLVSAARKYNFGDGAPTTTSEFQHSGTVFARVNNSTVDFSTAPTINGAPIATTAGSVEGNAATATKLETPRKINNTLFDGSADISFSTTEVAEGTNLYYTDARAKAAAPVQTVAGRIGAVILTVADITGTWPVAQGGTGTTSLTGYVKGNGTAAMTASATIPGSDITGNIAGNSATATKLATARTINGVSFDGSANISFTSDAVAEGTTNKYYTDTRVRNAISATGSLTYNATSGVINFVDAVTSVAGRQGNVVLAVADISGAAPLASPHLTGTPTAPTPATNDNSDQIATTAHVKSVVASGGNIEGTIAVQSTEMATHTSTVTGISPATIASFDPAVFRSSRFTVQISNGANEYQMAEVMALHDGTQAYMTIYNAFSTHGDLGIIECILTPSAVELQFTPMATDAKKVTVFRTSLVK